ncbi:MAG: hypothetical protein ACI9O0_001433 [Paracoccaceae bacterium]|jgi:hypothetical protein
MIWINCWHNRWYAARSSWRICACVGHLFERYEIATCDLHCGHRSFFVAMLIAQVPMLIGFEILTPHLFGFSLMGAVLVFCDILIGDWLARWLSDSHFDALI